MLYLPRLLESFFHAEFELTLSDFDRALNPHVKDDKRDFTKEAKLLFGAVMVSETKILQFQLSGWNTWAAVLEKYVRFSN